MSTPSTADWVIVGGGTAGCVLASRLKQNYPSKSIILLEVGPDEHGNPGVQTPLACFGLHGTPLQYNYSTVPQKHLDNRQIYNTGGKLLSGSSAVNYGTWTRGDAIGQLQIGSFILKLGIHARKSHRAVSTLLTKWLTEESFPYVSQLP